ncbi:MAG: UDP-N-acetylmuramyl-tripeptide synthetase [Bacteroidetes bacterium]|jgi:UDP-N-acetylmuramoyl-tripeptide--D-alanyl-D-alanine ligase|nr:UDP-N-acetylmuramyl-tripeptide synthetase [Bacteroidota bacterium]
MSTTIADLHTLFLEAGQKICTDTRKAEKGALFFALKGPNFNANELASQAIGAGCSYAVIDDKTFASVPNTILVQDVLLALQQLANYHRKTLDIPFIGITGSNGKTTTKELVAAVLAEKFRVLATEGNLNNHIGVPLTLLSIKPEHEIAIIEMGANHQGEIEMLCRIAEPDYGIITNIGKAHLEGFGGIEGVKKGKSELYKYIAEKKGKVFLHADDDVLQELSAANDKVTYGTKKLYDVVGRMNASSSTVQFVWKTRYEAPELAKAPLIQSHLVGVYNYYNLLCAACVGNYFQVEEEAINRALAAYEPTNNRSQLTKTDKNTLILDYYNANPTSMKAAIENFAAMDVPNKLLILGDMLELGEESAQEHQLIIDLLKEKKLKDHMLVGPVFSALSPDHTYPDSQAAARYLSEHPVEQKTILIKGSRGIRLETVLSRL